MASSDLDAPARVSCLTAARFPSGFLRRCVPCVVIFSFAFAGAAQCRTQSQSAQDQAQTQDQVQAQDRSVAEAARLERARKQNQQKKTKHVYTADDLKREHILTPEDRAELEARKHSPASSPASGSANPQGAADGSAVAQDAGAATSSSTSANVSLGEVARRLRRQKESQQLQRSVEFPLPFADAPVLASPKPPAQPLSPSATVDPPTVVSPAPRVAVPSRPFVKRSPFERPRALPAPPSVSAPRALTSAPLTPRVLPTPAPPHFSPLPKISGKLVMITVKPGDTLWKFAISRLGDGHRWQELLALNPGLRNPDLLEVGSQIVVPASLAPPRPPTKYTVRRGDRLWTIAQTQLGHGTAWPCIAHANPDLANAKLIHEGQVLIVPSSCPK